MNYQEWLKMPISKGAADYHKAVINASWHNENINELVKFVNGRIKKNNIVCDFGAGTGTSALLLLKNLKVHINLLLVDNSQSWLNKAHNIFKKNDDVKCILLKRNNKITETLSEAVGKNSIDHVISSNTIHLIPNLTKTFSGIFNALKKNGSFIFQSGNIIRKKRTKDILIIDDTIEKIHEISLNIINSSKKFSKYKKDIKEKIRIEDKQRKTIFPKPRYLESYLKALKSVGFQIEQTYSKVIKVNYADWLRFLRVKRLQAGILPEIGGKEPTQQELRDRDKIITMAAGNLFTLLKDNNSFADENGFIAEWVYVWAIK